MRQPDIYITGIGVVSCAGDSIQDQLRVVLANPLDVNRHMISHEAVLNNGDRFYTHEAIDLSTQKLFDAKTLNNFDRQSEFAAIASELALTDSGVDLREFDDSAKGVCFGTFLSIATSMSDFDESVLEDGPRKCRIGIFPSTVMSAPASRVSIVKSIRGSNTTLCSGKNSGFDAIGYSYLELKHGQKNLVVCGGSESSSEKIIQGLARQNFLMPVGAYESSYDLVNKIVPSEGACALVLQSGCASRQTDRYARLRGFLTGFSTCRKSNIEARSTDLANCINSIFKETGIRPSKMDAVLISDSYNGLGYRIELKALGKVFGTERMNCPILSLKRYYGESYSFFSSLMFAVAANIAYERPVRDFLRNSNINDAWDGAEETVLSRILLTCVDPAGHFSAALIERT